jgi:hypothetical protein
MNTEPMHRYRPESREDGAPGMRLVRDWGAYHVVVERIDGAWGFKISWAGRLVCSQWSARWSRSDAIEQADATLAVVFTAPSDDTIGPG